MDGNELTNLIDGCRRGKRESQKMLYQCFYNYGMTICSRYARGPEEAKEILNDAFLKVFTKIDLYSPHLSFKGWLNRIMVNTSIDYFRKNQTLPPLVDIVHAQHHETGIEDAVQALSAAEMLQMVQQLPPAYRMVFNLYVVEGFTHPEIAERLGVSVGASKSNLAKARAKLKTMIQLSNEKISKHA